MRIRKKVIINSRDKKKILRKIRRVEIIELSKLVNLKTQVFKSKKKYNRKIKFKGLNNV